jgi:hypothetical protein
VRWEDEEDALIDICLLCLFMEAARGKPMDGITPNEGDDDKDGEWE